MAMIKTCSSSSIERKGSWVIDLEEKLAFNNPNDLFGEETKWKKTSIPRLPEFVKMKKPSVFTPTMVAIGPYHHHKSDLQQLEVHKERALYHILKQGGKSLDVYVHEMMGVVEELQSSYFDLQEEWKNQDNFIKLMITDGFFMLEVMRLDFDYFKRYGPSDPFFSPHAMMHNAPYVRRDMLILENQLPILVLKKLVSTELEVDEEEAERLITELVVRFFVPRIYYNKDDLKEFTKSIQFFIPSKIFHALDIYRRCQLFISTKIPESPYRKLPYNIVKLPVMRSAARQREAGVKFKQNRSSALTAISFDSSHGILTLPEITVDDSTEHVFFNMVALEQTHAKSGSDILSYVAFMAELMGSAEEVQLLRQQGIVKNRLASDEDVSRLFYSMSKEIIVQQRENLGFVQWAVEKYCERCAYLKHAYYVLAAGFITFLTLVSTVVSFLQWRNI